MYYKELLLFIIILLFIQLDDETFEQDSSDSVRKLILRSRLQLNQLSKLVAYPNSNLTITEIVSG